MSTSAQKRLAILATLVTLGFVLAANAHLVAVAVGSQPACVAVDGPVPSKRAC